MAITRAQQARQMYNKGGNTNRERGIMSFGKGPKGTTGNIGDFQDTGPDRSAVGPGSKYSRNKAKRNIDKMRQELKYAITPSTKPSNRIIASLLGLFGPPFAGLAFNKAIDRTALGFNTKPTTIDDE